MSQNLTLENIGTWRATVQSAKNGFTLKVNGTFPTNEEKPLFELTKKMDPLGINPNELILILSFSNCVDKNGSESATVEYPNDPNNPEKLEKEDQYKTVLIIGNSEEETIANIEVIIPK